MSEIINYTRLTTSDKLENKFVTCQAHIPQDRDKAELGTIFAEIEIDSPWFATSQVGQTVINTLIKEYYRGTDSSELINFEEAIKKVNESLAHIAQSGETEWIGKLSGVLVLLNGGEINFSQTGSSHAYLYRTGKINHITEGLENSEPPHPLKTFSNLTSGSLQEDDKIIIANNAFFEVISPTELKLIITSLPPSLAAIECAKIMQAHGCQDANAIFIELTTIDKLANLPPDQKIEAVYLDQQILTLGRISKNAIKNITSSSKNSLKKVLSAFSRFSHEKIKPLAVKGIEKSKEKSKQALQATSKLVDPTSREEGAEIVSSSENVDAEYIETKTKFSLSGLFTKIRNKIRRPLIKIGFYTKKKSKMYLVLLVVVLVGLGAVVYFSLSAQKNRANLKEAEAAYQQIVSLSGEADILSTNNNIDSAVNKYSAVLDLQEKIKDTKYQSQAQALLDKASKKIAEMTHLKDATLLSSADLAGTSQVMILKDIVYASSGSDLYSGKTDAKTFVKTAALGFKPSTIVQIEDLDLFAALSGSKLISFNSTGNELKNSSLEFKEPNLLAVFASNLYVSDNSDNQLWKVSYDDGGFNKKSEYFKDAVNVSQIKSIAIDGSVYTMSPSGEVTRYSRGNKVSNFQVNAPGSKNIECVKILANDQAENMLIAAKISDRYRVIKIKKSGEIISQYNLAGVSKLDSISANRALDTIYLSTENKILSFSVN